MSLMLLVVGNNRHLPKGTRFGAPEIRIAHAINAPALIMRYPLLRALEVARIADTTGQVLDDATFLVCVAVLWYWIGLHFCAESTARKQQRPARELIADVLLVILGLFLMLGSWSIPNRQYSADAVLEAVLYSGWGLFFVIRFSHQAWMAARTSDLPGAPRSRS